ncbi:MAG TPA: Rieske (2Fe-2S) protein [Pyrinomonadaceae bacterium]|nr:Rieske (2Fe-2S) protein [Pyrinomonadaceae bacterium]
MNRDLSEATNEIVSDERNVRIAVAQNQAEFPYDREDESQVTRREFCNFLFLTSSALLAGAGGFAGKALYDSRSSRSFAPAKIDGGESLKPGSSLNFFYPGENDTAILIRTADGKYHAFEQKCTHLTCPVYFARERNRIECPCHEGGFDVETGNVLYGPPPRPLARIDLETRNGEVWAVGITKSDETI